MPGGVLTDHYLAIITVSAPMSCAHRLNLQLSVSLLCRLTLAIVLSPVKSSKMILLPPEGATFLEPCACTIPTVSALPDFVRPLNLQLSIKEPAFCQCRFQRRQSRLRITSSGFFMLNRELSVSLLRRLAIVLSPGFSLWLNPAPRGGDLPRTLCLH